MTESMEIAEVKRWDAPGILSIVVQGSLLRANLLETANACRHWRQLFPQAQIVLSVSSSDVVIPTLEGSRMIAARLSQTDAAAGILGSALTLIQKDCDVVVWAEPRLPLPPIKSDAAKANNMNLQIAASRAGLAAATGRHVLRIRCDAFFASREFLAQWEAGCALPRGHAAVFTQRVLISWLFTLNPYTIERLPLHFSDWFHFGLTEDVRRIWDVPDAPLADAVFYLTHPHLPGSTAGERLFNTRIAVEQHVAYQAFKPHFPQLTLERHNDPTSADLSIDILRDNFILCDLVAANYIFPKYRGELSDPTKEIHCLTPQDWRDLATQPDKSGPEVLAEKILAVYDPGAYQRSRPFPRIFYGHMLWTKCGAHLNGAVVGRGKNGTLIFGPLIQIPQGRYVAEVELATTRGPGRLEIEAKIEQRRVLRAIVVHIDETTGASCVSLPFNIEDTFARDFEIVVETDGLREVAVSEIRILPRPELEPSLARKYPAALLAARESEHRSGAVRTPLPKPGAKTPGDAARAFGRLFTGPGDLLPPGTYRARVLVAALSGGGAVQLRISISPMSSPQAATLVAAQRFPVAHGGRRDHFDIVFTIPRSADIDGGERVFEIDCSYEGVEAFAVSGVELTRIADCGSVAVDTAVSLNNLWLAAASRNPVVIVATSERGLVFHGPYARIEPGRYRATIVLKGGVDGASLQIKATGGAGRRTLGVRKSKLMAGEVRTEVLDFQAREAETDFEIALWHKGGLGLEVSNMSVQRLG